MKGKKKKRTESKKIIGQSTGKKNNTRDNTRDKTTENTELTPIENSNGGKRRVGKAREKSREEQGQGRERARNSKGKQGGKRRRDAENKMEMQKKRERRRTKEQKIELDACKVRKGGRALKNLRAIQLIYGLWQPNVHTPVLLGW